MAVIGCDIPVSSVVGAEVLAKPSTKGIWVKTLFKEEGNYLTSTTYLVADGEPKVFSMRIDLRPLMKIAARVHQRMHEQMAAHAKESGQPLVGFSFKKAFRSIKKAAKKIGHSKLLRAVGGAVKAIAKSKLVGVLAAGLAVAVPVIGIPALAAYGTAHAAIGALSDGKKLVDGAVHIANTTKAAGQAVVAVANIHTNAVASAKANLAAAKNLALQHHASPPTVKAQATQQAKAHVAAAKHDAKTAQAAKAQYAPVIATAAKMKAKLADPAVRVKLLQKKKAAESAATVLEDIKRKAKYGTPEEKLEAQKNAAIVNLTAQNGHRIQALAQLHAGGLPGILIDKKGKIIHGRFRVSTNAPGKNPDVLYTGKEQPNQSGAFAKVSGVPGIGATGKPSPFPPLSPREQQKRASAIHDWLNARGAKPIVPCGIVLKTPPPPKVAPTVGAWSIGCDCEGSHF